MDGGEFDLLGVVRGVFLGLDVRKQSELRVKFLQLPN